MRINKFRGDCSNISAKKKHWRSVVMQWWLEPIPVWTCTIRCQERPVLSTRHQWFCCSRNICWVTPEILHLYICFFFWIKVSIIFYYILKTEAVALSSPWAWCCPCASKRTSQLLLHIFGGIVLMYYSLSMCYLYESVDLLHYPLDQCCRFSRNTA